MTKRDAPPLADCVVRVEGNPQPTDGSVIETRGPRRRRGGDRPAIAYTVGGAVAPLPMAAPLGRMLVAATDRGLCMVGLGDTDAVVEHALAAAYPEAARHRDDVAIAPMLDAVIALIVGDGERDPAPPIDVRGTAFQRRVWQALRAIPRGETRSYAKIAAAIGKPRAARAVGRACAANPVAIVIPCHRVVAGDGQPHGYRWGMERKRILLAGEAGPR